MKTDKFEKEYFTEMYDGNYDKRNPPYKFRSYLSQIKPFIKNKSTKLLDIGCAYGSFLKEADQLLSVSGTDISEHAIAIAKTRLKHVQFSQSSILDIPQNEKFDIITCFDVLEHVPDIDAALIHIKGLLKEDGILVFSVPVYDTLIGKLVEKLDKDPTHVHKKSRYWWGDLLKKHSFDLISWKGIWRYYFKNIFYLHGISSLTKGFTPAIFLIARTK